MNTEDLEKFKRIPRNDVLLYIHQNELSNSKNDFSDIYHRINKPTLIFCAIIDNLIKQKLINCKGYYSLPKDRNSFFPEQFKTVQIGLTDLGRDYTESKILGFNLAKYSAQDPLSSFFPIKGFSGNLDALCKYTFNEFSNIYKGSIRMDLVDAYYCFTGKTFKRDADKRLFISYSWDSDGHIQWVKSLAEELSKNFQVEFDKNLKVGMSPENYMKHNILSSDYVLIIFTPAYLKKTQSYKNSGAKYEFSIISEQLFKKISFGKYIPILKEGNKEFSIPAIMQDSIYLNFTEKELFEVELQKLKNKLGE